MALTDPVIGVNASMFAFFVHEKAPSEVEMGLPHLKQ